VQRIVVHSRLQPADAARVHASVDRGDRCRVHGMVPRATTL